MNQGPSYLTVLTVSTSITVGNEHLLVGGLPGGGPPGSVPFSIVKVVRNVVAQSTTPKRDQSLPSSVRFACVPKFGSRSLLLPDLHVP